MQSKKSDSSLAEALDATDLPSGAGTLSYSNLPPGRFRLGSLKANLPLPILFALLIPLSMFVESDVVGDYYRRIIILAGFNIILAVSLQLINGFSGQFSLGHAGFMAVGAYLAAYPAMNYSQHFADPFACLLFYAAVAIVFLVAGSVLLAAFLLIRWTRKLYQGLPMVLLIAMLVWAMFDFARASAVTVGNPPKYYIWWHGADSLVRLFSWVTTHGRETAAHLSAALPTGMVEPLSFIVLILGAGACAGAVGLVVGMPALRLRGDYLAIATLGFAEIIKIIIRNSEPLGGALGLVGIPKYTNFAWLYGAAIVTVIVIWRIAYSPRGRAIMAVREDEIAAAAIGIDPTRQKVTAFITGAFFGGVAGAMFSMHEHSITPESFGMAKSIEVVVMVTLGGLGSISGAILAAIVLTILPEFLRNLSPTLADFRMVIYSALLIVMMLLRPQGLLGGREIWPWRRFRNPDPVPTEDRDDYQGSDQTKPD